MFRRRWGWIAAIACVPLVFVTVVLSVMADSPMRAAVQVFDIENLTNNTQFDYVAKGTTDQLINRLLDVPGVHVLAAHGTRAVSKEPKAGRFALDGTLQAYEGQIRLAMMLTDNEHQGDVVWSQTFDSRELKNPLTLQSDIAGQTVYALEKRVLLESSAKRSGSFPALGYQVRLLIASLRPPDRGSLPTSSNTAFDLYMRGHHMLEELSGRSAASAIEYFRRATDADPHFALAYSAAADATMQLMNYNYRPHVELAPQAREFARRGVEECPTCAEVHSVMAAVQQMDWDWSGAEQSYREALRLKPRFSRARRWYGGLLAQFGRWDEALSHSRAALEMDPLDRSGPPTVGFLLFLARQYDEAARMLTQSIADKDMDMTRANLGELYAWRAHTTTGKASAEFERLALEQAEGIAKLEQASRERHRSFSDKLFAITYSAVGDRTSLQPYLSRLEQDMGMEDLAGNACDDLRAGRSDGTGV